MIVYHWTSRKNVESIMTTGLRQYSFVCRDVLDYVGEVCLEVNLPYIFEWETWQHVTREIITPNRLRIIYEV